MIDPDQLEGLLTLLGAALLVVLGIAAVLLLF